jgi:hypothetical protein
MTDSDLLKKITEVIIEKTVNQKIPTIIILSEIKREDLVKNLFWTIKSGNKNEETYTPDDWKEVADIMRNLSEIPLLIKNDNEINNLQEDLEYFIKEMGSRKGIVVINSDKIKENDFTATENISIVVVSKYKFIKSILI